MPRWPGDTRQRLVAAATELFAERGYSGTTVDDIAAAAETTQRTFFRHFADKEEVLFADDDLLLPLLLEGVRRADPADPRGSILRSVRVLTDALEPRRAELVRRATVIRSDIALSGRELTKQARWEAAVRAALLEAGYPADRAGLLAAVGFAVYRLSLDAWLIEEGGPPLRERVARALDDVAGVLAPGG